MNKKWAWLTAAAAVGCSVAPGEHGRTEAGSEPLLDSVQVATEVEAFLRDYQAAIEGRDEEGVRSRLIPDRYRWAEEGEVAYKHADDVIGSLSQFPPGTPIRTSLSGLEVTPVAGGRGAHAVASFTTELGSGEAAFTFGGVITFVLERTGDTWRIVGGHASSSRPAPPTDPPGEG